MVAINVSLGSGADERASTGKLALRSLVEHKSGNFLTLEAWKEYALSSEPLVWNLPAGGLYEVREIAPRGKRRVFQVPVEETDYADLIWLEEIPGATGAYVLEPTVTEYADTTGEPDIGVGDYWIATDPAHPDYGYLMQKGS